MSYSMRWGVGGGQGQDLVFPIVDIRYPCGRIPAPGTDHSHLSPWTRGEEQEMKECDLEILNTGSILIERDSRFQPLKNWTDLVRPQFLEIAFPLAESYPL